MHFHQDLPIFFKPGPVLSFSILPIDVARIFSGMHFFRQKVDSLFSRRPQHTA